MDSVAKEKPKTRTRKEKPEVNLPKRWLNVQEAADYLGCSTAKLNKDRQEKGELGIPFVRLGRAVLYDLSALDEYLESVATAKSTPITNRTRAAAAKAAATRAARAAAKAVPEAALA